MIVPRAEGAALVTRKAGWLDIVSTMRHFAIVTWSVDPHALAAHLPDGIEPDTFTLADGRSRAFVSAVVFENVAFRPAALPFARFRFGQTNYRAYVRRGVERAVWFFRTSLASLWVHVPRVAWAFPWVRAPMQFDAAYEGEVCTRYRHVARGGAPAELELEGTREPVGTLDGFADDESTALALTHPLVGYLHRTRGGVATYSVWHERLSGLRRAHVVNARFELFARLGLVAEGEAPHSALVQRETELVIHLPPRRV